MWSRNCTDVDIIILMIKKAQRTSPKQTYILSPLPLNFSGHTILVKDHLPWDTFQCLLKMDTSSSSFTSLHTFNLLGKNLSRTPTQRV